MPRILIAVIAGILALAAFTTQALAQKRVALVIGNGAYTKVPRLDNPKNDAAAIEAMFKAAGFTTVVRLNDLGVAAMKRALRDFSQIARDADVAVVFYAGHGIEVAGVNYLVPTDAALEQDVDAQDEAVPLDRINQALEQVKHLRLVILDACRDNPFARSMKRTMATRSVRSGYGEIDERSLPPNTLVAYAQRAGFTAEDGVGSSNSPFTTALIKHLPTPGLDIELALRRVRDEVLRATKNRQEPFKYGSLSGTEIALVTPKVGELSIEQRVAQAAAKWETLRTSGTLAELQAFAAQYADTYFAGMAQARIDELKKQQVVVAKSELKKDCDEGGGDVAILGCTELIRRNPSDKVAYFNRGSAYSAKKDYDRAIADYSKAIELDPKYAEAYSKLGVARYYKGDFDHAIADYSKAIELDPTFAEAYNNRGIAHNDKADYGRAIADYSKAIELDPKYVRAYYNRGYAYSQKRDYDRAVADYSKAIELDPKYVHAYYNRGDAYSQKKDYDRAVADYSKAIELDPKYAQAYYNRGSAYSQKKDYDHAIADYSKAIELDPEEAQAYYNRGNAYSQKKDYDRAIADYSKAIQFNPMDADAYESRGNAFKAKGDRKRADADYAKALAIGKLPPIPLPQPPP